MVVSRMTLPTARARREGNGARPLATSCVRVSIMVNPAGQGDRFRYALVANPKNKSPWRARPAKACGKGEQNLGSGAYRAPPGLRTWRVPITTC